MDYFAHGLWSYIFFHKINKPWYAIFFGLLPDNVSWLPVFIYGLVTRNIPSGAPVVSQLPEWVFTLYGVGHSLVLAAVVFAIIYFIFRTIPIYMWAWPIAIVMDTLSHSREFLPTPFLWPVSDWTFPGVSWGQGWFMLTNWILIIGSMIFISVKKYKAMPKKRKKRRSTRWRY